jgi:phosphoglycolate phosphatase-like HAD superfamily hydrolase
MIFRGMDLFSNLENIDIAPEEVAVVGDTESDMRSGVTAGARFVVGVTSGAHTEAQLRGAGATHVLASATELLTVINQ